MPESTMYEFAHTELAQKALLDEASRLSREDGVDINDAMVIAAATLDGAGDHEGKTVESMQTCMNLFGEPVRGLSTDDTPIGREDAFAETEEKRLDEAEANVDYGALWLTVSEISNGGIAVAKEMSRLINEDESNLDRIMLDVRTMVEKKFSDPEIIAALKKILKI